MDLIVLVFGIFFIIFGLINIWLRWCCDDMEALSWFMFIGGIVITIIALFSTPVFEIKI